MKTSLRILIIDDEEVVHRTLGYYLQRAGHEVGKALDERTALQIIQKAPPEIVLLDLVLPGTDGLDLLARIRTTAPDLPVVIITGHGSMDAAIQALRLGAADFLNKPVQLLELDALIEKIARLKRLQLESRQLRHSISGLQSAENLRQKNRYFVGESPVAHRIQEQIKQAVEARVQTLLITGETGTGKEVVARAVHFLSAREEDPFIAINCPALTESIVEAELFGHEKGAFTGAEDARPGYFEMAQGGTLFLDEIGDLSIPVQAALLRAIETRRIRRISGTREIEIDCRIMAATNTDLPESIQKGTFRADLFYRLNLFHIHIPPLREHPQDILPLARHFLSLAANTAGKRLEGFSPQAQKKLLAHTYPGNARELRNMVEQAVIVCPSGFVESESLIMPPAHLPHQAAETDKQPNANTLSRQAILQALEETHWNRRQAAHKLGITYAKLRYWIQKHNIL